MPRLIHQIHLNNFCLDIDECELNPDICVKQNAICINKFGTYECVCNNGFVMSNNLCYDKSFKQLLFIIFKNFNYFIFAFTNINECHLQDGLCLENEFCLNTPGSFDCICEKGFMRIGNMRYCTGKKIIPKTKGGF
jgi:hypothetical protein